MAPRCPWRTAGRSIGSPSSSPTVVQSSSPAESARSSSHCALETERDVDAERPALDVRAPHVRPAESEPLRVPKLIQEIEHQASVRLVHIRDDEPALQAAIQIGAAEIPSATQLMSPQLSAEWDIDVD